MLRTCLEAPDVSRVRVIARRAPSVRHHKLAVVPHTDYAHFDEISASFADVDVCLYCLGKSVQQVSGEDEYRRITHDFALAAARELRTHSPDAVFHFLSGEGASLDSRVMWCRVKAETERALAPFGAVCWRPGLIDGMGSSSEPLSYKVMRPLGRLFLRSSARWYVTGEDLGRAMLATARQGRRNAVIENATIRELARAAAP